MKMHAEQPFVIHISSSFMRNLYVPIGVYITRETQPPTLLAISKDNPVSRCFGRPYAGGVLF